ncbi:hypothetical protein [Nonomuraea insulae]|uniref:Uncharacterized protein n=1 Tax=Nonomuraea insulae TaxID=1616787 RepID=A0ABW1D723_9ACTN
MFIRVPPTAVPYEDHAGPGRLRRLALALFGPVVLLVAPMTVVAAYGERLPGRVYVFNWPLDPGGYEPTWDWWTSQPLYGWTLYLEIGMIIAFFYSWRLPQVQRGLVQVGFLLGVAVGISTAVGLLAMVDTPSAARPPWLFAAELVIAVASVTLGRAAVGPLPQEPEATLLPPAHVQAMPLTRYQRVLFTTSAWSIRTLVMAAAATALLVWIYVNRLADGDDRTLLSFGGLYMTVWVVCWPTLWAAQAYTRLQIDGSGVTVRVPLLPMLSRTVPYARIRFAEARSTPPEGRYKLGDTDSGWGVVSGKGSALVLALADSRSFVYSTREAETAARLVNGWLNRQRGGETAGC